MHNDINGLEDNIWSSYHKSASELSVGSKISSSNGIVLEKISEQLWEYKTASNKISYSNNSIDNFKQIEYIEFNVETA